MSSSTRLDSAVFHLTPTRTRCDLVIIVNGKKEKIASGLLNPFLAHLKTARDQMAKGGYSITLEPELGSDATWFTRGTVERFVRFVSTPEILERVYTIESEILQIEEAIAIQGNNSIGISSVEENQVKHLEYNESTTERTTSKTLQDTNDEKAIVLYQPDVQPPEANEPTGSEGNSKVQLLKVLETRKSVLQKEQGMAFARAAAAGFDIDYMPALMSFAECFGASRLMDACKKFKDLWKRMHETGQWLEIDAAEAMSSRPDYATANASGIIFSNMVTTSHSEMNSETNGKASTDVPPMDRQPSVGPQENVQGQFPQYMYPPWPIHSPPGTVPVYQPYPVQGIPYYQNYPGNSPYMQPLYPPMEDPRLNAGQSQGRRRHSMDSRYSNTESEAWDVDASNSRYQEELDGEQGGSQTGERRKKGSGSRRQKSSMVVIRNINYVTKTENSLGSGSCSDSGFGTDEDNNTQESVKSSRRKGSNKESAKKLNFSDEERDHGNEVDGGHWQAFQNCLLRDVDEDNRDVNQGQYEVEKVNHMRKKKHVAVNDPLISGERNMHETKGNVTIDMGSLSRGLTHMPKVSNDELLLSGRTGQSGDGRSVDDVQSSEINGRRGSYRGTSNDDFMILKQDSQYNNGRHSTEMVDVNSLSNSNNNLENKSSHKTNDDSYILEYRSVRVNDPGNERNAIGMDSEFPMVHQKAELSNGTRNQINYEPDELTLMPERGAIRESVGYDPAFDYEMQDQAVGDALRDKKNKEVLADTKLGSKKLDKDRKSKVTPNSSDKKKNAGPIRRGKPSKMSPLDEARARAEKLRNYKADLQKMKKDKEEEEVKRLEALKMERQKRIAARSGSTSTHSPVPSQPTKKQLPKLSPSSHRGSKFSDSEPGSSSPLQRRFPIKTGSVGSHDTSKVSRPSKLNTGSQAAENRLTRSVSTLPESKHEKAEGTSETKASMARIRRLSEPKMSTIHHTSSAKPQSTATISKTKPADGSESKRISAIVSHDKSKAATLPELKIKTPRASDITQNRSSVKEKTQKTNGTKSSKTSEGALPKKTENGILTSYDGDENPVIEKTVVMLECEKPSMPAIPMTEEKIEVPKPQCVNDKLTEKTVEVSDYVAIRAPVSPQSMDIVDREVAQTHLQPVSIEVKLNNRDKESSKPSTGGIAKETYHAPYARVSSMEDPCTENSEYGKALPTSMETAAIGSETARAHVSDSKNSTLDKISEVAEKPRVKDTSKGFRRLLKFGRKNHSSGRNMESDNGSIDGSEADEIGSSSSAQEVHILKNLISQDEVPTSATPPQKSSRSFSLLSPFRSKEKKVMMA